MDPFAGAESFSIDETNKVRASLGLKPLQVQKNGEEGSQEQQAVQNLAKQREIERKEREATRLRDQIAKSRDRVKYSSTLKGRTLADDDEEEDTLSWIRRTKTLKPVEETKRTISKEYSEKDLRGLRVGHDMSAINNNGAILTLADNNHSSDDELIDVNVVKSDKTKKNMEDKKKRPVYNPYEDEYDEEGNKKILKHYDEVINPDAKNKGFKIGEEKEDVKDVLMSDRVPQILHSAGQSIPSDYMIGEVKIKKKRKKAPVREVSRDDSLKRSLDLVETKDGDDDDELQQSLATQRRIAAFNKVQQNRELQANRLADVIKKAKREETDEASLGETTNSNELVINELTDFIHGHEVLHNNDEPQHIEAEQVNTDAERTETMVEGGPNDSTIVSNIAGIDTIKIDEEEDGEITMTGNEMMEDNTEKKNVEDDVQSGQNDFGMDDEPLAEGGMAAALNLLQRRGLMKKATEEEEKRSKDLQDRDKWLLESRRSQIQHDLQARNQREKDRASGKFDRMTNREREAYAQRENRVREQVEAQEALDRFKDYKPNVELKYTDEFGRNMAPKEAFKYLSHQFHGKGSGNAKKEKRLKRINDEQKERDAAYRR